jgi:hypothetical protein
MVTTQSHYWTLPSTADDWKEVSWILYWQYGEGSVCGVNHLKPAALFADEFLHNHSHEVQSLCSLHSGLRVYLQSCSIIASKRISQLDQTQHSSKSLSSLNHNLQVHLPTQSITDTKWICKSGRSHLPGASRRYFNHALQGNLLTGTIMASKGISEFTWSWPPSASPTLLDYSLQVNLSVCSTSTFKCNS